MSTGLFAEKEWILLPNSPSLQYNNLSHHEKERFCYVHLSDVVVINKDKTSTQLHVPRAEILYQACFTEIAGVTYLIAVSNLGVNIWSSDTTTMLFSYCYEDANDPDSFLRGVAGSCKERIFAVGSNSGDVLVFDVPTNSLGNGQIVLQRKLSTDKYPIVNMTSSVQHLVVANDFGDIYGFNFNSPFSSAFRFTGNGTPCTSMLLRNDVLISSYCTGCIRVFRLGILEMSVELAAHGGCITALAIHPQLDMFASCSDSDQTVCIFSFPTFMTDQHVMWNYSLV